MTAAAFREHLDRLAWTQRGVAVFLGVAHNTVHRWAMGQAAIPKEVAAWLRAMAQAMQENPPPRM
jgi:plasmid maintenance system antidote protein VapI